MLAERSDSFDDVVAQVAAERQALYERARALLDEQTAALIEGDDALDARHTPYNPYWRGLSSAARRLVRAHELVEQTVDE